MNNHYPGGKGGDGTYQQIINYIPPHKTYVSPFAGKDAIYRNISPAGIAILNDTDPEIVTYWKHYLKSITNVKVHENFIQGSILGKTDNNQDVIIRNNDAVTLIKKFQNSHNTFIYCDPPYPMKTRKSNRQLYAFEFADDKEHIELLEAIRHCNCDVMISTYENKLYEMYLLTDHYFTETNLRTWHKHSFVSQTRQGQAIETIYFNYPPPVILHDFRYLGTNYRERERIKRKVKRFQDRMQLLPAAERNAILSAAIKDYNDTLTSIITF